MKPNTNTLLPIEKVALKHLLAGDGEVLNSLRSQVEFVSVVDRLASSVGCVVNLCIENNDHLKRICPYQLKLCSLDFDCPECPRDGVGLALHLSGGLVSQLEFYTYDDPMPVLHKIDVDRCKFEYVQGRKGDLARLKSAFVQKGQKLIDETE